MSRVLKIDGKFGVGYESAQEFLHVMDFLQEVTMFAKKEFESDESQIAADSVEELVGKLCIAQLAESYMKMEANPDMLEEVKLAAMMEQRNDSHGAKSYNDTMYG